MCFSFLNSGVSLRSKRSPKRNWDQYDNTEYDRPQLLYSSCSAISSERYWSWSVICRGAVLKLIRYLSSGAVLKLLISVLMSYPQATFKKGFVSKAKPAIRNNVVIGTEHWSVTGYPTLTLVAERPLIWWGQTPKQNIPNTALLFLCLITFNLKLSFRSQQLLLCLHRLLLCNAF